MRSLAFASKVACVLSVSFMLGLACRHSPNSDPELEELLQTLTLAATADAAGSCTTSTEGGSQVLTIRATSQTNFTLCDLSNGTRIEPGASDTGDISLQRFKAATYSGTSATGGGGGACQTGVTNFDSVTSVSAFGGVSAPDCPQFIDDEPLVGASVGGGTVNFNGSAALKDWYLYNIFTNALSAREDVYIIRSSDGSAFYKLQMLDYYDPAGTSGYPKFRYAEITP